MIRRALAEFGEWFNSLVSLAPQVQFGIGEMAAFLNPGPAAGDAAGTSPGAASTTPCVPAPGRPDLDDQVRAVRLLIEEHYISVLSADGHVACHCERWEGPACGHADHIAEVVGNMLAADARMSAATNKFRQ